MAHGMSETFNEAPLDARDWDGVDYLVTEKDGLTKKSFLPEGKTTVDALRSLGAAMSPTTPDVDSVIPAPYTYLGQFIDHDIAKTVLIGTGKQDDISKADLKPLSRAEIPSLFRNKRTSNFDLDCLYGNSKEEPNQKLWVPFDGDIFRLGQNSDAFQAIPVSFDNDLPRINDHSDPLHRRAKIGDERNDENVIVSQLHLAFLKFHNSVVTGKKVKFDIARQLTVQHYQWLVVHDFLMKICDPAIVNRIIEKGNQLYRPRQNEKYMPLEFSVAAYRFGHSMVRTTYDFSRNFRKTKPPAVQAPGTLGLMFQFSGLNGDLGGAETLPANWIVEWDLMLKDRTTQLDTNLTPFFASLPKETNVMAMLASRNLLRGYLFRLPTGQALASLLLAKADRISSKEILNNSSPEQAKILVQTGLDKTTPLWFYILAEAKARGKVNGIGGNRLGSLGSLIVAETVIGLMRANPESIFNKPFQPTLGQTPGSFDLQDLLMRAGVLAARVA